MKTNSDEMHNQEMLLKKIRQSSEVFDKLANSYEVWVPESGWLAGRRNRDKNDSKRKNLTDWSILSFLLEIDNCHYPMADSYLQYGIDGVIRIAAETLETLKNNLQSELQDQTQLDIAYLESLLHVWKRFRQFVADHMVLALECAKQETSDTKKKRYEKIAKICQNLTTSQTHFARHFNFFGLHICFAVHLAQDVLEDLISCYIHFISMIVKWVFGISKKQKKCLKRCLPE